MVRRLMRRPDFQTLKYWKRGQLPDTDDPPGIIDLSVSNAHFRSRKIIGRQLHIEFAPGSRGDIRVVAFGRVRRAEKVFRTTLLDVPQKRPAIAEREMKDYLSAQNRVRARNRFRRVVANLKIDIPGFIEPLVLLYYGSNEIDADVARGQRH